MSDFFSMGGYAFYVWGSFGACALVIALELAMIRSRRAALRRQLPVDDGDTAGRAADAVR